ncbi:MAG: hypothetical protein M3Q10_13795 [Chloroflexota bacterium]|nr:hypothetical protein [Chloroflexota bacterium]
MRRRLVFALLSLLLAHGTAPIGRVTGRSSPEAGSTPGAVVLPPDAPAYGGTYGEWSARQWQWLLSFPNEVSPYTDATGERCGLGQSGPVFFLTGTTDDPGIPRDCTVPAGVALFVPVVAAECSTVQAPPLFGRDEAELAACAGSIVGGASPTLGAVLDGESIPNLERYRVRSPRFSVALPPDNRLGVEPGVAALVSDGYWLLLAPLPPGRHVLRLGVSLREPEGEGGVTYRLTVAEPWTSTP